MAQSLAKHIGMNDGNMSVDTSCSLATAFAGDITTTTTTTSIATTTESESSSSLDHDISATDMMSENEAMNSSCLDEGHDVPDKGNEVEVVNNSHDVVNTEELSSPSAVVPLYVKSFSRRNFAALLIRKMVGKEIMRRSNVNGRGKERLDRDIIRYVKSKAFEYYPCQPSEVKKEWRDCIISIDESCRRLNKPGKSVPLGNINQ